jgi:phage tail sheath protein FI
MAQFLSPGINATEIDLTTIIPAVSTSTGAIAGPFRWGPVQERTLVDSELTLRDYFGTPDNLCAETWFTASSFLAYTNSLYVVRAISTTGLTPHKNSTADGAGILIKNRDHYLGQYASGQGAVGMWAARYPGTLGNSIRVSVADVNSFDTWAYKDNFDGIPGTSKSVADNGGTNDEVHVVVVDKDGKLTGVAGTVLERYPFLSKAALAKTEDGSSQYYAEVINRKSRWIWWMDHPTSSNWGGPLSNAFTTLDTVLTLNTPSGTFQVGETVRYAINVTVVSPGSGATATANLNAGAVDTITVTAPGTLYSGAPIVTITGDGTGATATATVSGGGVTAIAVTSGGSGYTNATVTITPAGSGATVSPVLDADTGAILSIAVTSGGSGYTGAPNIVITGPGTGATATATISTGAVTAVAVTNGGSNYLPVEGKVLNWTTPTLKIKPTKKAFVNGSVPVGLTSTATGTVSAVTGGVLTYNLAGGVDDNANVTTQEYILGYEEFRSVEEVDISLVLGGPANSTVAMKLIDICEFRKDCIVLLSPPRVAVVNNFGHEVDDIIAFRNLLPSTSYGVIDSGWKEMYDVYNDVYRWVPLNGDVAGLCARTDDERDAWWSPAGYNRGIMKNVVRLAFNPKKAYRDQLYQNGINSVMTERGQGTLLFGDKTMLTKPSAFDRINVRRLFIVLRKAITRAAKYTLFEFNDDFTRAQFVAMVEPYLRDVQGRRGIYAFRVVCDGTNNTPEVIDSNRFVGDIYIKPARSINYIQLNFIAVRTGVDFSEVVGKF